VGWKQYLSDSEKIGRQMLFRGSEASASRVYMLTWKIKDSSRPTGIEEGEQPVVVQKHSDDLNDRRPDTKGLYVSGVTSKMRKYSLLPEKSNKNM
jgi:hypothetical protein